MQKIKVIYMGTPNFALSPLQALINSDQVELLSVFTRPDSVRSRGNTLIPSPVKELALSNGVKVYTPNTLRDPDVITNIRAQQPDLIVVAAYGLIIPKIILDIPTYGCLNIHASLLPRWRGAAPIHRAILAGDKSIGVCIMIMEESLDTGDYFPVGEVEIGNKSLVQLTQELSDLGAKGIIGVINELSHEIFETFTAQDEALVTYAEKISKLEVMLDPFLDLDSFIRRVHISNESLPARCIVCGKEIAIFGAHPLDETLETGCVRIEKKRILIGVDGRAVQLDSVKPKGKKTMDGLAFKSGLQSVDFLWSAIEE